jgi:hypothetical protein
MLSNQIKIGKKIYTVKKEYVNWLKKYKHNKKVEVGGSINCVVCDIEMTKKKASYVFCGTQCKDDFWNKIDPRKRNSKRVYNRSKVISNNSQSYKDSEGDWCTQGDDMEACDYHNK